MARESAAQIGSGTAPFVRGILDPTQRGVLTGAEGLRSGTNVVIINSEDLNSVDAFATSGVEVTQNPQMILHSNNNLLPRMRNVTIQNVGLQNAYVGSNSGALDRLLVERGYVVTASGTEQSTVDLPILHNVDVWAVTRDETTELRMLIT